MHQSAQAVCCISLQGRAEGRIYKRLRVLLRYTACTGLINQHYSHIASFVLAAVLGAEVVLPPAAKRDSFGNYFSTYKVRKSPAGARVNLVLECATGRPVRSGGARS